MASTSANLKKFLRLHTQRFSEANDGAKSWLVPSVLDVLVCAKGDSKLLEVSLQEASLKPERAQACAEAPVEVLN